MTPSSTHSSPSASTVQPYRMHVSQKYLDLTRQKLELTRLPRDPRNALGRNEFGVTKTQLEPLVDHWLERYDWRVQEAFYNDSLPQYRVPVNGTRIHFVHKRSTSSTAIPLLFVHGWPESFISASKIIDLCDPGENEGGQAFHVVVPSIPGFGFSDPIPEAGNNMQGTADVFDALMKGLGYMHYIAHGSEWGFKVCRILAFAHSDSCIAVHTVNPDVPAPRSAFGYTPGDLAIAAPLNDLSIHSPGLTPTLSPSLSVSAGERPQTIAYGLCDSPAGLLAHVVDAIRPLPRASQENSPTLHSRSGQLSGKSPISARSPQSVISTPGRSPSSPITMQYPDPSETTPWDATSLINWTMLYWLPGPEVALRWLVNSSALVSSLWLGHSTVPLGITHFRDSALPSTGTGLIPPEWAEAYHPIALLRRREGRVRYPAWEKPAEIMRDIRELVENLGLGQLSIGICPPSLGHEFG